MLAIILIILCIYLCVRVAKMQKQLDSQQKLIDELTAARPSAPSGTGAVARVELGREFYGCKIGPDLEETLRALKRRGNMDAAIFELCKATGLSEEQAREYLAML